VAAEASYQKDVPVQINGNDLLSAALGGAGPYGSAAVAAVREGEGTDLPGYVQFDKTQFQVNTVKSFSGLLGAESLLLVGEVGLQTNDVPDYEKAGNLRFGRAFIYGPGILPNATTPSTNLQPDGRKNDGYVTDFSWGYRMRARLDYDGLAAARCACRRASSGTTMWTASPWTVSSSRTARPSDWALASSGRRNTRWT